MELEDEKEFMKKKCENLSEKLKTRDEIIKHLIEERDSIKYSNNCNPVKKNLKVKKSKTNDNTISTPQSPERVADYKTQNNVNPVDNLYIQTETNNTNCQTQYVHYIQTDTNQCNGQKTPNGLVKILKNIFISDKK
jgi:hypothetical protein